LPSIEDVEDMEMDTGDVALKFEREKDIFATYTYAYESGFGFGEGVKGWTRLSSEEVEKVTHRKEGMYMRREHDCWKHCDFPSECRHAVYAACVEGRAKATGGGRRAVPVVLTPVGAPAENKDEGLVLFPGQRKRAGEENRGEGVWFPDPQE
jgi:hypothetical protein